MKLQLISYDSDSVELPEDLKFNFLRFLTPKEVVKLSEVSSLFNNETKSKYHWKEKLIAAGYDASQLENDISISTISNYKKVYEAFICDWKAKMIAKGCNENVVQQVIGTGVISNYTNLYERVVRFDMLDAKTSLWELLCLSGEVDAVNYGIQNEIINADTLNEEDENALHLTALAGNAKAMDCASKIPGLDLAALAKGKTRIHYAALSGSAEVIELAIQIPGFDHFMATCPEGLNGMHYAAWSGSAAAMDQIFLRIPQLDLTALTMAGANIMHVGCVIGSVEVIDWVCRNTNLSLTATTAEGFNAMHLAVQSRNPLAVLFLRKLGLGTNAPDNEGITPLQLADRIRDPSVRAVRDALTMRIKLIEDAPEEKHTLRYR